MYTTSKKTRSMDQLSNIYNHVKDVIYIDNKTSRVTDVEQCFSYYHVNYIDIETSYIGL